VSLGHGKFSEKTLLRVEHWSGAILLGLALVQAAVIIWRMQPKH
jgi:hypothetical protein